VGIWVSHIPTPEMQIEEIGGEIKYQEGVKHPLVWAANLQFVLNSQ